MLTCAIYHFKRKILTWFLSLCLFLINNSVFAYTFDFVLEVSVTDETCLGNGSLLMNVSNTAVGSTIIYDLYLLPDITNPIAQTSSDTFTSLQSGNYRVVAREITGSSETSQFQDVTIENLIEELNYTISQSNSSECDSTGTLTVNIISGTPQAYEIVSGPLTIAPQDSNVFIDLPSGIYVVRVYDNCGDAVTKTFTFNLDTTNLTVSESELPTVYEACDSITISNTVNAVSDSVIIYPLEVTYTIYPPDGTPEITITQTINNGSPSGFVLNQTIPLYGENTFLINLSITDTCGNIFSSENEIDPNPEMVLLDSESYCGKYLQLIFSGYHPPYNLAFTNAPAVFNPSTYNEGYPGPYNESIVQLGDEEVSLPEGTYEIEMVDSCGRTCSSSIEITSEPVEPNSSSTNIGCDTATGSISINIPDRLITSAQITLAPNTFPETLPFDLASFINEETVTVEGLPVGDYVIHITDECGDEYFIDILVPEFVFQPIVSFTRPDCNSATGSLQVYNPNAKFDSIIITSAPVSFPDTLPTDVSNSINSNGSLYLYELPEGDYLFETTDICGNENSIDIQITAYQPKPFSYNLTRHCGSFDIEVSDDDLTVTGQTYWFQKYFALTNSWGHPYTASPYSEGNLPNSTNSIQLFNDSPLLNMFLTGEFRIVKAFQSFNQGNPNDFCLDIFQPFIISESLIISNIYNLSCEGGNSDDIVIDAIGVAPFNFTIVSPIVMDNGNNNVFSGLTQGVYEIKVEDGCGNIENIILNTENLLPLARAFPAEDMLICKDDGIANTTFDLSTQNNSILGYQDPSDYLINYYTSQQDASLNTNPINTNYTNTTNPQEIYARVEHKTIKACYATTSFLLNVGNYPNAEEIQQTSFCDGGNTTLIAPPGYSYEWSNGATTQSIIVTIPGSYFVTLKNLYGNLSCDAVQEYSVTNSGVAEIEKIIVTDWTDHNNSITIQVSGPGNYVYSLDSIHFQENPNFNNLSPGSYTVYVMDLNGCGITSEQVSILNYPKFFTPNGDGFNDTWQIYEAGAEPNLEVTIFDRYGKLIKRLGSNDYGWDGTYNGIALPTSDYWFVVNRSGGKIHKGHFTLKR